MATIMNVINSKIIIGVDSSQTAHVAVKHVIDVFAATDRESLPVIHLTHVIERALPAGSASAGPAVSWEAGGLPETPTNICTCTDLGADANTISDPRIVVILNQMKPLKQKLIDALWPIDRIKLSVCDGGYTKSIVADILAESAVRIGAAIVVVGRTKHGRFLDAFMKSTGEKLVHCAPDLSVWVVGSSA